MCVYSKTSDATRKDILVWAVGPHPLNVKRKSTERHSHVSLVFAATRILYRQNTVYTAVEVSGLYFCHATSNFNADQKSLSDIPWSDYCKEYSEIPLIVRRTIGIPESADLSHLNRFRSIDTLGIMVRFDFKNVRCLVRSKSLRNSPLLFMVLEDYIESTTSVPPLAVKAHYSKAVVPIAYARCPRSYHEIHTKAKPHAVTSPLL